MRLARRVEDLCAAFGEHSGEQDVLGTGHCRKVEHDPLASQPIYLRDDLGRALFDPCAHLAQAAEVLLDAPGADVVTAGPRQPRLTEASEQRTEQKDRRAHSAAELGRDACVSSVAHSQQHRALALRAAAQAGEDLRHQRGVGHFRHVVEAHRLRGQQRRGHLG